MNFIPVFLNSLDTHILDDADYKVSYGELRLYSFNDIFYIFQNLKAEMFFKDFYSVLKCTD